MHATCRKKEDPKSASPTRGVLLWKLSRKLKYKTNIFFSDCFGLGRSLQKKLGSSMNLWSAIEKCYWYLVNNGIVLLYSPKIFVNYANKPSSEMYTRGFRSLIQLKRMELWIGRGGSIGAWLVYTRGHLLRQHVVEQRWCILHKFCKWMSHVSAWTFFSYTLRYKFFSRYAKTSRTYYSIPYSVQCVHTVAICGHTILPNKFNFCKSTIIWMLYAVPVYRHL